MIRRRPLWKGRRVTKEWDFKRPGSVKKKKAGKLKWYIGGLAATGVAGVIVGGRTALNFANYSSSDKRQLRRIRKDQQAIRRSLVLERRRNINKMENEF